MADLAERKKSAVYQRRKLQLKDREWRLDNLYWIRNEEGQAIPFKRNAAQLAYDRASWCRDVIPKARKLGFSTFIALLILDECVFRPGTTAGIVDRTLDDAESKLAMIKFAYDRLPDDVRGARPLRRSNQSELAWSNDSSVSAGTTYRGDTPRLLHVSEFGKTSIDSPEVAREVLTGAIQAVPSTGRIWVESTSHGISGKFKEMVDSARASAEAKRPLTALDFKMHFFGWWMKPEYKLPNNLVVISQELREYFAKQEKDYGIAIDADQQAWYARKYEQLGPEDVRQEFPTNVDELFYASIEGAFFRAELAKARREQRIGQPVPHDPSRRVNTFWDIGEDMTAIWFHQTDGVRHRFIDYYEDESGSMQITARVIADKARERQFVYERHIGPHDLNHRVWVAGAKTRKQMAAELGIKFETVPKVEHKEDSIEAARRMLGLSWICQEHCAIGLTRLENYRKRWNDTLGVFTREPVHDHASHGSDAFQQGAMFLPSERIDRERRTRPISTERRASHWSA